MVRIGQDTKSRGYPDSLNILDSEGRAIIQEISSNGRQPDQKLFLGSGEVVTAQCLLGEDGKKLSTRAVVVEGAVTERLHDTTGNSVADTREVYQFGQLARLDADTNGDRRTDVVQYFAGGEMQRQDEDIDFDGVIDRRFENGQPVDVPPDTRVPGAAFDSLGCGSFHRFWWKR